MIFLYKEWNTALQEGRSEIQYDEEGILYGMPIQKNELRSTPIDLTPLSRQQRFDTLKNIRWMEHIRACLIDKRVHILFQSVVLYPISLVKPFQRIL